MSYLNFGFTGFDFSGKKVRKDGIVLDKFSLCQHIHHLSILIYHDFYHDLVYSEYPELFKYSDCVLRLKELLSYE